MTYSIYNVESGNALAWFDSTREAYEAVLQIAETDPEAIDELGLVRYDDEGKPVGAAIGQELINEARLEGLRKADAACAEVFEEWLQLYPHLRISESATSDGVNGFRKPIYEVDEGANVRFKLFRRFVYAFGHIPILERLSCLVKG